MRLRSEAGSYPAAQVDLAFALALGRPPAAAERAAAIALAQQHGITLLCRSLYNASEFITVRLAAEQTFLAFQRELCRPKPTVLGGGSRRTQQLDERPRQRPDT